MQGLPKRKQAVLAAVSGIAASLAIFGSNSASYAAENDPQTRPSGAVTAEIRGADGRAIELSGGVIRLQVDPQAANSSKVIGAETPDGRPWIFRIADGDASAAQKDDDSDIVRRLRKRRDAEAEEEKRGTAPALGAVQPARPQKPANRAPENVRTLVSTRADASLAAPGKVEKETFLGVGATPAPAVLTHQLKLPADFGLAVEGVAPGSAADKAGVKPFDILEKLDDQLLVDDRQLNALVHSHKPGETVTLSIIREGKPLTLKATLGQHAEIAEGDGDHHFELHFNVPPGADGPGQAGEKTLIWRGPGGPGVWNMAPPPGMPPGAGTGQGIIILRETGEPRSSNVAPPPGAPVPPGAGVRPREGRNPEPKASGTEPRSQAKSAIAEPDAASAAEAARLEQELRSLQNTANELRAQLKARQQQEAGEQKEKAPADKD